MACWAYNLHNVTMQFSYSFLYAWYMELLVAWLGSRHGCPLWLMLSCAQLMKVEEMSLWFRERRVGRMSFWLTRVRLFSLGLLINERYRM